MPEPSRDSAAKTADVQRLFVGHSPSIRRFVFSLAPHAGDTDDIVQEVFLTITAKAGDFEPGTNFRAWAFAIARLKVKEWQRSRRRAQLLTDVVIEKLRQDSLDDEADAEEGIDDVHRLALLRKCLERLAPKSRTMIELQYLHGLKPAEVAERLAWTANAAYVALSRARAALRRCVESQLRMADGGGA